MEIVFNAHSEEDRQGIANKECNLYQKINWSNMQSKWTDLQNRWSYFSFSWTWRNTLQLFGSKYLAILTFILYIMKTWEGLTSVPIQQRSTLRAYDTNSMFNFDQFGIPITKYSDPLHVNIDYTYYMSQMQPGLYQFKKYSHSSMTLTVLQASIFLNNYNVMDIWNNGDTLDYIVATNTDTNNVEIVTLIASGSR